MKAALLSWWERKISEKKQQQNKQTTKTNKQQQNKQTNNQNKQKIKRNAGLL